MARWHGKVQRFDEHDGHVDTWRSTVEAETEDAAEEALLHAYAALPEIELPFSDGTSFYVRVDRVDEEWLRRWQAGSGSQQG